MKNLDRLEDCLIYRFRDRALLKRALTHRSVRREHNERLEFLGDSILGFIIADSLYHQFPYLSEGDLTRMRATLVRRPTLASLARTLELGSYLKFGPGVLKSGGFDQDSILSDALEAILGAVYLDGGVAEVKSVIQILYSDLLSTIADNARRDNKTQLQEWLQKHAQPLPVYELVEQQGKAHQPTFHVQCHIEHPESPFLASGHSRRVAEQEAAGIAILALQSTKHAGNIG